ncbi:metal-dependent transcriptional regulator [Maribacter sp. 2307ULW6-5]|uniref:metal-dependent transcriptional regulator n=1 Tax=Maribacter sp. 2307ULW6-5 TaxID=3386275 RepID=UPI0039BD424E
MTTAEADYLMAIYLLQGRSGGPIATNALAAEMGTRPASVTDMVQRLHGKGLVRHRKYKGVQLTQAGAEAAQAGLRRVQLWELFLGKTLSLPMAEVRTPALQLAHLEDAAVLAALQAFLGNPALDLYGRPLAGASGDRPPTKTALLNQWPVGTVGQCSGVKKSSEAFARFMEKQGISVGDTVHILEKEPFDASLHIQVGGRELLISDQIAGNLFLTVPTSG